MKQAVLAVLLFGMAQAQADELICESADQGFHISALVDAFEVRSLNLNGDEFFPMIDENGDSRTEFYETDRDLTLRFREVCDKNGTCVRVKLHAGNRKHDLETFNGRVQIRARRSIFPNSDRKSSVKVACRLERAAE